MLFRSEGMGKNAKESEESEEAEIILFRGSWIEFATDINNVIPLPRGCAQGWGSGSRVVTLVVVGIDPLLAPGNYYQ